MLSIWKLKTLLIDSLTQFKYHRMAFDKALGRLQELLVLLQAGFVPENRDSVVEKRVKELEALLHRSADRIIKQLGVAQGSEVAPSHSRSSIMHNLKVAYNDTLRFFYAFYQTRVVHFYLQQGNSVELLKEKLEENATVFSSETLEIHNLLDQIDIESLM